jgi:glycosyltransferase involved in cell wall biosynthesis
MLSIIIPVRNSQDFIAECLGSIFSQNVPVDRYEVILSDNCSTDRTLEVVQKVIEAHPHPGARVKIFRQSENLGAYGNLNFLLDHCSYPHAQILCADDHFAGPDSVARILATIEAHPGVALFAFDNNTRHADAEHWKLIHESLGDSEIDSVSFTKFLFSFGCFFGGLSNICIDRSKFAGQRYFNPDYIYSGDIDFYARAAIHGARGYLSRREVTFRRHHAGSISSTQNAGNRTSGESIATTIKLYDYLRGLGFPAGPLRFTASWHIAQFYHGGFKSLLTKGDTRSMRNVIAAHRKSPAFYHPLLCMLLAIAIWPRIYRHKLHTMKERHFVRYLMKSPTGSQAPRIPV